MFFKTIPYTLLTILLFLGLSGFSDPIDSNTAKIVAKNFLLHQNPGKQSLQTQQLYLTSVYSTKEKDLIKQDGATIEPLFYVYNVKGSEGFVIVSADDDAMPILGYSTEGDFTGQDMPDAFEKLLEKYKKEIKDIKRNNLKADEHIKGLWKENKSASYVTNLSTNTVGALIQTRWGQGTYYNDLCPYDETYKARSLTGCVATAMAQIMKYWNCPIQGSGFHSYNHSTYGTLSTHFGNDAYNWSAMSNLVTSANNSVAGLMYDIGVSIEMDYGPAATGGSAAYVISDASATGACAENAMKTYFGFSLSIHGQVRSTFTDATWIQMLKDELDSSRPVLYSGFGQGGHAFVCDGYDNSNNFHFNWGWGGMYNGFFNISSLNPGTHTYNSGQQGLFSIKPKEVSSNAKPNLQANSIISVTPDPIQYGYDFTVSIDIRDSGNIDFIGDFAAAVFDEHEAFVDFVEIKTGVSLTKGSSRTFNFSTPALTSVTPGDYLIIILYKLNGEEWTILHPGSYYNAIYATVQGPFNDLALYDSLLVNPYPIIKGKPASILTSIYNSGTDSFTGDISVDLHEVDGTWIKTLDEYTNVSLCSNCYFDSVPFLADSYDVDPGSYLLVVWDRPTKDSNWNIVSSDFFPNPVRVVIAEGPLSPDPYEPNNTDSTAYNLPVNFIGNKAHVSMPGSNIHIGTDHDYYKVQLPSGEGYSIMARINDVDIIGNVDVFFAYNDGTGWSDNYDDHIGHNIVMSNGGILTFAVAPSFSGNQGPYLFNIYISKTNNALINVTSPTVGNNWFKSTIHTITWNDNLSENVSIELFKDFDSILSINSSTASNGTYSWTVPASILSDINYQIRISSTIDSNIFDYSDFFAITTPVSVNDKSINAQLVRFYPNPANSYLNIQILKKDISFDHLSIINSMGEIVFDQSKAINSMFNKLDISALLPGVYYLTLSGEQKIVNYRFTVVK